MPKKSGKAAGRRASKKKTISKRKTLTKRKEMAPRNIIIKRTSGRKEKFDKEKMVQTISRSGTPYPMAREVARKISRKVTRNRAKLGNKKGQEIEVDGGVVRKMVVEELRSRNRSDIASSIGGEISENTRQGRHEMMDKNEPVLDSVAANRTNLLFDNSTKLARNTKRQG